MHYELIMRIFLHIFSSHYVENVNELSNLFTTVYHKNNVFDFRQNENESIYYLSLLFFFSFLYIEYRAINNLCVVRN